MTVSEKVAYIKGMFDGMALDTEVSKEAKLIGSIIEVLEEVSLSIEDIEDDIEVLAEEIEAISDDLEVVEEELFEDDDCCCDDEDYDDEDDFFEVACPNCEEDLVIDADVLEAGYIQCPNCEEKFAIDLSDECGCDCGCCDEEE